MTKISAGHTLLFNDPVPNSSGSESGGSRASGTSSGQKATPSFPFIIGVAGGSSSGKSEVCERIVEALGQNGKSAKERQVFVINQDSFYRKFNDRELKNAAKFEFNFDHPNAVDLEKLKECMRAIKRHEPVTISHYNYRSHSLNKDDSNTLTIHSADVVIVEGILVFYDKEMRELFDLKLFVDTDSDTRLARRVLRDTEERSRNIESVLSQYIRFVKPAFEEFCLPTKKYADVIIPRGNDNNVAVSLIVQHIQDLLQCNAANNSRRSSIRGAGDSSSRSSGSSRGSSIPGSPLNKSLDHISSSSNQATKTNQVSKTITTGSGSTSRSPVNVDKKSHSNTPSRSSPTSSSYCKRTKGSISSQTATKPPVPVGGALSINSSHVKAMPCHVQEFPALRGPQCTTTSNTPNFTNSVH
ncbi:uridine-cytidine kinase 2-like [Convolutriloba macropyga]|uniref:uridine-cytidine kinase 2-like n=1 Tax=Convolutriloba macropyga TaxID=536237 RepID=UPI003F52578B